MLATVITLRVSPELVFTVLSAAVGAVVSIGGVWIASVRRTDKMGAQIAAIEVALKKEIGALQDALDDEAASLAAMKIRDDKLREWQIYERGKSERSDVRALANPSDTLG